MSALTAANAARRDKALDRLVRLTGEVTTFRRIIESGAVAYSTERRYKDGTKRYGLILAADIEEESERGRQGSLTFSSYIETPKMVADYAELPRVVAFGYDGIEVVSPTGEVLERFDPSW